MQFRTIDVSPLSPYLGTEIFGIHLTKRPDSEQVEELHEAFSVYQVIFFRNQRLDYDGLNAPGAELRRSVGPSE